MALLDRTNEEIELSQVEPMTIPDNTDGRFWGPREPEHTQPATLSIDADGETNEKTGIYEEWVWFMFATDDEPWFRLTYDEAEKVYDRLGRILGK